MMGLLGIVIGWAIGLFILCGIFAHRERKVNEAFLKASKDRKQSFRAATYVDIDDSGDH